MSLTISIRFLTGRAHLHPWQTHHSEGRVEWPPSPWRLLRAIVAAAGRGLTSLPYSDEVPPPKPDLNVTVSGMSALKKRGVSEEAKKKLSFSKRKQTLTLKEPLTDEEAAAWKAANPGESFASAIDKLRVLAAAPDPVAMADVGEDEIPLSRLAGLLAMLSTTPAIWLPKTSGGHTRQYFPIHESGMVRNTGSAVFDTFAAVAKDQALLFYWPEVSLDEECLADLRLILARMTYFGRAESWCLAEAHTTAPEQIDTIITEGPQQTHWQCICIEDSGNPPGKEYRDYTLERRLARVEDVKAEAVGLLPRTKTSDGRGRKTGAEKFKTILQSESLETLLLRCLLRESGQDITDGLERPIGTRWVHYAVPRAIYALPVRRPQPRRRTAETVHVVRFGLNTATVHRPVLPLVTDTLLVADKFRAAALAIHEKTINRQGEAHARNLCGRERTGEVCSGHTHAFFWPTDDDNDGFIDHVTVYCSAGFEQSEIDALRRLARIRQRRGRPDLLVTPVYAGPLRDYAPWDQQTVRTFVSATPYFCPVHLSHGKGRGGKSRPIRPQVLRSLIDQKVVKSEAGIKSIDELIFDYDPEEFTRLRRAVAVGAVSEPLPPRQYFPAVEQPTQYPPLPRVNGTGDVRYQNAVVKNPDAGYTYGLSVGLFVDNGTRFVRALSFCRRRRNAEVRGPGRMLRITFRESRPPRPFAIGSQCHFGLGLFVPEQR